MFMAGLVVSVLVTAAFAFATLAFLGFFTAAFTFAAFAFLALFASQLVTGIKVRS